MTKILVQITNPFVGTDNSVAFYTDVSWVTANSKNNICRQVLYNLHCLFKTLVIKLTYKRNVKQQQENDCMTRAES